MFAHFDKDIWEYVLSTISVSESPHAWKRFMGFNQS